MNQWRWVFLAAAISYFLANVFFCILGSGKLQPWNDPDYKKQTDTPDTGKDVPLKYNTLFTVAKGVYVHTDTHALFTATQADLYCEQTLTINCSIEEIISQLPFGAM